MRIAMFAPLLGVEATGQSLVAANTANHLAAAGHRVTVLATDCGYRGQPASALVPLVPQVDLQLFPVKSALNRRLYRSPELVAWARAHIATFDVLDVQGAWSWSGVDLARLFHAHNKPYILTPHGAMTRYDWRKTYLRRRLFFLARQGGVWSGADAVRFTSAGEQQESYFPAAGHSVVIPNGTDLLPPIAAAERAAVRQALGVPLDSTMLLFLGRITHQKGVKEIVAAFEIAAPQLPHLRLYLVGFAESHYGQQVLAAINSSSFRDRIVFVGPVFGEAHKQYFRAADLFITLSRNEGLSLAQLDALAHGVPAVLTRSGNLDQIEEYGAGALTTHDPAQVAHQLVSLLADPAALTQASLGARLLVEGLFSWPRVIPQLAALYADVIASRSR